MIALTYYLKLGVILYSLHLHIIEDGKVISFGWNSGGIGKTNDFAITRILLVAHGGWHNDTIYTVEIKQ